MSQSFGTRSDAPAHFLPDIVVAVLGTGQGVSDLMEQCVANLGVIIGAIDKVHGQLNPPAPEQADAESTFTAIEPERPGAEPVDVKQATSFDRDDPRTRTQVFQTHGHRTDLLEGRPRPYCTSEVKPLWKRSRERPVSLAIPGLIVDTIPELAPRTPVLPARPGLPIRD